MLLFIGRLQLYLGYIYRIYDQYDHIILVFISCGKVHVRNLLIVVSIFLYFRQTSYFYCDILVKRQYIRQIYLLSLVQFPVNVLFSSKIGKNPKKRLKTAVGQIYTAVVKTVETVVLGFTNNPSFAANHIFLVFRRSQSVSTSLLNF
ncbi:Hypothetical_protein [Hexamita inflata]|uniref:Hypothetical_protein n=1 Tax=Hexamita inflata TaxID=28002 RepID=A0AA86RCM4_9EUKA|nr:Hypothetical protein HINF_LOCUS53050 [Hexamita inflata]